MIKYPSTAVYQDVMGRVPIPPAVSILLPFHQVFSSRAELQHRIKVVLENVRHQLLQNYTAETATTVMDRLEKLNQQVNAGISGKGIVLFASPHKSRLCYLDQPVEERIVIGDSFAVRELVADAKQLRQYLVLILSDKECRFFLAGEGKLERLKAGVPTEVYGYVNEKPEPVANFSDAADRREVVMDKFLHHMDEALGHILASHPLPVFVLGPERVIGHFKAHSRHLPQIAAYVHGNYVEAGEPELQAKVEPCFEAWRRKNEQGLLGLLERTANVQKLSMGMPEAWSAVSNRNGQLLVVEKNYRFPARRGDTPDRIFREDSPGDNPFFIADAVDVLIGQVIIQGGDVEFVDDGILKEYGHVALVRYY